MMPISIGKYLDALKTTNKGVLPLDSEQEKTLKHDFKTPLWIIAGPGTGKTHTLVWLLFKRVLVDNVPAERIIITTFTRKAAAELQSRLIIARQNLIDAGLEEARAIDISQLNIGTLHSLCSDFLQNLRYDPTIRIKILEDELIQQFFVRRTKNPLVDCDDIPFWSRFGMANLTDRYPPNKSKRAEGACKLFNRITENSVDVDAMFLSGDVDFERLADAYVKYEQELTKSHKTDQAHLQKHFLEFLDIPSGQQFIDDGFTLLVDEYQDTNPIQEQIYFKLVGEKGDLTVVGDDDQSLYRFRGATVESLIDFDNACNIYLGKTPQPVYLCENRRSHPLIVEWVNRFIDLHPEMRDTGFRVRAPGKLKLQAKADIDGDYAAVMAIIQGTHKAAAAQMASVIEELSKEKKITDYSQIALLTFSTRESPRAIGEYTKAISAKGIPVYNPRSKQAQKDKRLQALIGALSSILDPSFDEANLPARLPRNVPTYVQQIQLEFEQLINSGIYPDLKKYVESSRKAIKTQIIDPKKPFLKRSGGRLVTLSGLLYKLLGHEPFAADLTDSVGGERFKAINLILADYESLFNDGYIKIEEDPSGGTRIGRWDLYNFYGIFVEGIHDGLNDPEDEEVSIQEGMVNVMTIHQSKGLQFEVVFVLRPDKQPYLSDTHIIEDELDPFINRPTKPVSRRSPDLRAAEDAIRLFFVAYSRAKRLLVLCGSNINDWNRVLGCDDKGQFINSTEALQKLGVQIL